MRRYFHMLTALLCLVVLTGCRSVLQPTGMVSPLQAPLRTWFAPPGGVVFTKVKGPLSLNWKICDFSDPELKQGKSDYAFYFRYYLPWAEVGDLGIKRAMENGEITKLYWADYTCLSILGYLNVYKVTAYGK